MINVWSHSIGDEVKVTLESGKTFAGKIITIDDDETTGFGEDSITVENKDELRIFLQSDIVKLEAMT